MALSRAPQRPAVGATRARQGRLGRHVLWVLVFGIALVVLGFFAAFTWKSGDLASTEPNNAREAADAQAFNAPEPAPVNGKPPQITQPGSAQGEVPPVPAGQ
ncbi:hypothetical protein [Phenylobacterium sp.]|jgi:hypothetical protein|uniref:hypothetical protein n=1 Tax=Phenylobacterium sp. TaxID=1871053 RepID=UPI002F94EAEA